MSGAGLVDAGTIGTATRLASYRWTAFEHRGQHAAYTPQYDCAPGVKAHVVVIAILGKRWNWQTATGTSSDAIHSICGAHAVC